MQVCVCGGGGGGSWQRQDVVMGGRGEGGGREGGLLTQALRSRRAPLGHNIAYIIVCYFYVVILLFIRTEVVYGYISVNALLCPEQS